MSTDLRYPIGKFEPKESYTGEELKGFIQRIETLPARLEQAVARLSTAQLDTRYREGGWTRRQVIHHVADSHMNAYIRTKWTLTENSPLIKAYFEKEWAQTPETNADPALSLTLLKALHAKWIVLIKSLSHEDLKRSFIHPDTMNAVPLERLMGLYAWHGDHHLGHVNS